MAAKLGEDPAMIPNTPVMQRVALKAHLLPMISHPKPHPKAPTKRPTSLGYRIKRLTVLAKRKFGSISRRELVNNRRKDEASHYWPKLSSVGSESDIHYLRTIRSQQHRIDAIDTSPSLFLGLHHLRAALSHDMQDQSVLLQPKQLSCPENLLLQTRPSSHLWNMPPFLNLIFLPDQWSPTWGICYTFLVVTERDINFKYGMSQCARHFGRSADQSSTNDDRCSVDKARITTTMMHWRNQALRNVNCD